MRVEIRQSLRDFFFAPATALPLATLRIGIASVLLLQAYYLLGEVIPLYGASGLLQHGLNFMTPDGIFDTRGWLRLTSHAGMGEKTGLYLLGAVYVTSLLLLLVGWKTRIATFFAWLTHMLWWSAQVTAYGLDIFAHQFLFLLLWMPCGARLSVDSALAGHRSGPSWQARLSLRVLQLQLCIAYLWSGIEKMKGSSWWSGEAIWRSLMLPIFNQYDMSWLAAVPWLAKGLCYATLLTETGYFIFIWPRRTRKLWCAAAIGMHLGIGVFLGLWLFALIMIVLNVCLFLVPAEAPALVTSTRTRSWPSLPRASIAGGRWYRASREPSP